MRYGTKRIVLARGFRWTALSLFRTCASMCRYWFVFSGHKIFGPTGIGMLFGKAELLEAMPPWQGGNIDECGRPGRSP